MSNKNRKKNSTDLPCIEAPIIKIETKYIGKDENQTMKQKMYGPTIYRIPETLVLTVMNMKLPIRKYLSDMLYSLIITALFLCLLVLSILKFPLIIKVPLIPVCLYFIYRQAEYMIPVTRRYFHFRFMPEEERIKSLIPDLLFDVDSSLMRKSGNFTFETPDYIGFDMDTLRFSEQRLMYEYHLTPEIANQVYQELHKEHTFSSLPVEVPITDSEMEKEIILRNLRFNNLFPF